MLADLHLTPFVFTYGTLKEGYGNHVLLAEEELVGDAVTKDEFTLTDCGFPYMFKGDEQAHVVGEVYHIKDPDTLMYLDALEGVDFGHYERVLIPVMIDLITHTEQYEVWAYQTWPSTGSKHPYCPQIEGMYVWN